MALHYVFNLADSIYWWIQNSKSKDTIISYIWVSGHSRFQLSKSDQQPGIALILTLCPQRHVGENSGIKVNKSGEVVPIQVGVPFLLQVRQIWLARLRGVWADNLLNVVRVICNKCTVLLRLKYSMYTWMLMETDLTVTGLPGHYRHWNTFLFCLSYDRAWQAGASGPCAPLLPSEIEGQTHNISLDVHAALNENIHQYPFISLLNKVHTWRYDMI